MYILQTVHRHLIGKSKQSIPYLFPKGSSHRKKRKLHQRETADQQSDETVRKQSGGW